MPPPLATAVLVAAISVVVSIAGCGETETAGAEEDAIVQRVADGDSLVLRGGARVRLLQIDAPEIGEGECYGREALRGLERILQPGDTIVLESDPRLDQVDRYQRLLRYVHSASTNVNVELVRRGAATPYFRGGERGRHADTLLDAVDDARGERRGLWGACRVSWEPNKQVETHRR